ncbi:MAG: PHP domain-containing protein [Planctomycetota bacterium]
MWADLHVHTHWSDGTDTPREVMARARAAGVTIVAVTDHDTVAGVAESLEAGQSFGVEVLPALEITTSYNGDEEIHLLGYFINPEDPILAERLAAVRDVRRRRIVAMAERFVRLGMPFAAEEVLAAGRSSVGRPHVADILIRKGYVRSTGEAFERWLKKDAPGYVPKTNPSWREGIAWIREAGGIAVMAHPGVTNHDEVIAAMAAEGLSGLEVWYPRHDTVAENHYLKMARRYHLVATGGSDCHGRRNGEPILGKVKLPVGAVEELKKCRMMNAE